MTIEFTCSNCHREYSAPDRAAGRKITCSSCKAVIQVPEPLMELEPIEAPEPAEDLEILDTPPAAELEILEPIESPPELEILPQPPAPAAMPAASPFGPRPAVPAGFRPAPGAGMPGVPVGLAPAQVPPPGKTGGGTGWVLWAVVGGGAMVIVGIIAGIIVMATDRSSNPAGPGTGTAQPVASNVPASPPASSPSPSSPPSPSPPSPSTPGAGSSPPAAAAAEEPKPSRSGRVRLPRVRPTPENAPPDEPSVQAQPARVWTFQPDPGPALPPLDPAKKVSIPVGPTATAEVVFPTRPSRFVAVGSNRSPDDYREVWNLQTGVPSERIGGQMKEATHFALSPDGKHLAALTYPEGRGRDAAIEVRAAASGKQVASLPFAGAHWVRLIDFAADGQVLAACDSAGSTEVTVWSIADKRELRKFKVSETPCAAEQMALTPGGKCLAAVNRDVKIFDLATGRAVLDLPMPTVAGQGHGTVQAVAFSPDSRFLAFLANSNPSWGLYCLELTSGSTPTVRLIGPPWSDRLRTAAEDCPAPRLEWLPDDRGWLAFGSIVLDRRTGQGLWEFAKAARQKSPRRVLDAKRLLAVTRKDSARVLECLEVPEEKIRVAAEVARQGGDPADVRIGATVEADRSAEKAIQPNRGQPPAWSVQADPAPPAKEKYHEGLVPIAGDIRQVRFSRPDAGQAVVLASQKQAFAPPGVPAPPVIPGQPSVDPSAGLPRWLERFDLLTGKQSGRVDLPVPGDLLDVSPSGRLALVRFGGQRIDVYAMDEGKRLCGWRPWEPAKGDKSAPRTWGWFVDETHVLSLAGPGPCELVLWEVPKCRAVYSLTIPKEGRGVMSPGRKYVALLNEKQIDLLEAATGELKGCLPIPPGVPLLPWEPGQAAFSLDGTRLAVTSGGGGQSELLAWDLATGQLLADAPDTAAGQRIQWCGPQHVLLSQGPAAVLVDLERVAVIWRYRFNGGWPLEQPPDDRQWHAIAPYARQPSYLAATSLLDEKIFRTVESQVPKGQTRLWGPGTAIVVDGSGLNVSSPDLRAKLEAAVQRSIQASGFAVGQGQGIRLQVSCAMIDSQTMEYRSMSGGSRQTFSVKVPRASLRAAMTDGANLLWEQKTEVSGGASGMMEFIPGNQDPQKYLENQVYNTQTAAMEGFFGSLRLPRAGYTKLRDGTGQPGLGETPVNLAQIFEIRPDAPAIAGLPQGPAGMDAGLDPDAEAGARESRSRDEESPLADAAFEKTARDYVGKAAVGVIAADDAAVVERVRWFPAGKRPVFGLRWGVGVQFSGPEPPKVRDLHDLGQVTGEAGPAIGVAIQNHVTMNEFGKWPPGGDAKLRQVAFLGLGKQEQLVEAARRQAIDVVALLNVQARTSAAGKKLDNLVRARFIEVASGKTLWASEPITGPAGGRRGGGAATERAFEQVLKRLDDDFCLKPMPEITAEQAKKRLASLGLPEAKPASAIAALVEVRYYQAKQLLTADEAAPHYETLLGKGKGRLLATGDRDQRRGLVQEWIDAEEKRE